AVLRRVGARRVVSIVVGRRPRPGLRPGANSTKPAQAGWGRPVKKRWRVQAALRGVEVTSAEARRAGALWAPCLLLLVAWALHWRTFGVEELGQDGALSVDLGLGSLGAMLVYTARDVHPPLFFALLHWSFAFGGPGYLVAKFVPIAAAQLSLLVLYRLVRILAGTLVAWCAVLVPFSHGAPVHAGPILLAADAVPDRPFHGLTGPSGAPAADRPGPGDDGGL